MRTADREIDRFTAASKDGTTFVVIVFQEYTETRTVNGEWMRIDGFKRLELEDGSYLNQIDPNTFKIVSTDEVIQKVG
jgi:hypothetical protein